MLLTNFFVAIKIFCVTGKFLQRCLVYEHWGRKQPIGRNDHPHSGSELGGWAKLWCAENLHNLQVEVKSFREDSLNERKEQQAINETLLCNIMGGSLQR